MLQFTTVLFPFHWTKFECDNLKCLDEISECVDARHKLRNKDHYKVQMRRKGGRNEKEEEEVYCSIIPLPLN